MSSKASLSLIESVAQPLVLQPPVCAWVPLPFLFSSFLTFPVTLPLPLRYATEHRCGVVVRGPGLSDRISATDPLKDGRPLGTAAPLDGSAAAQHTAAVVTALSEAMRERLRGHPINAARAAEGKPVANVVLLRGCGIRIEVRAARLHRAYHSPCMACVCHWRLTLWLLTQQRLWSPHVSCCLCWQVPSFESRHGLRAAMVAPTKIIAGLGLSLGMDVLHVPKATGDFRTCLASKAEAAAAALCNSLLGGPAPEVKTPGEERAREGREEGYDFAFLHVKVRALKSHQRSHLQQTTDSSSPSTLINTL